MIKSRIELHLESSYDYLSRESMITPQELVDYITTNNVKAVSVVDYLSALTIPVLLNLKKEKNLKTKFIFGISVNIRYNNLYVPSVILAKSTDGLKKLYEIITMANKQEKRFLMSEELKNYHTDLIYGISEFDLDKDYQQVIKYYEYIELDPATLESDALKIEKYALNNNLLLISSNKPNTLNKKLTETFGIKREYLSTKEMLKKLNYLQNPFDVVINNAYKLSEKINDYELPKVERQLFKYTNSDLKKEIYERANLLYLDNIPSDIKKQIDKELKIIQKYHLNDTILLLKDLIRKTRLNSWANLGGYLSNTLIAYILGLTEINMMDLKNKRDLEKDILKYGYNFRINTSSEEIPRLQEYLRRLTNQKDIFYKGTYRNCQEIYSDMGIIPNTCYIIPSNINILDYTPLNYLSDKMVTCFNYEYLDQYFASIYFANPSNYDLLNMLEEKCQYYTDDIPLNLPEVVKETYKFVENYDTKKFLLNNYMPELRIPKKEKKPQTLEEIIDIENLTNANWQSKVISYYYLNYYKVKYPSEFYDIYYHYITDFLRIEDIKKEKNVEKLEIVNSILKRIKNLKLTDILEDKSLENIYELKRNIWQNKITLINYEGISTTDLIVNLLSMLSIKSKYKIHLYSLRLRSEYFNRHLIKLLSGIDNKTLIKYFYPYLGVSKNYSGKIASDKLIETVELIQKNPLYISSMKAYEGQDYLNYVLLNSDEEIALFEDLDYLLQKENLNERELINKIRSKQKNKRVIIMSRCRTNEELFEYQSLKVNVINVSKKGKNYNFNLLNNKSNILLPLSFGK